MDKVILGSSLIYYLFSFLGISYIHLFIIVCSLFTLLIIWKSNAIQENDVSLAVLLFSLIALGISLPLFENDHFRYFFEGKLFLEGVNIYRLSPQEFLLGAETIFRDNLGFPDVPSIYGPFAHIFHGLTFSLFGFSGGLFFIKLLYLLTFIFLWKKFSSKTLLLFCLPFLTKEFFNSIHLDFFAVLFFMVGINQFQKNKYYRGLVLIFLCLLIKPTGFIALPLVFLFLYKQMDFKKLSVCTLPFFLYAFFVSTWPSITIFAKYWEWNSGFAKLLEFISPYLASWSSLIIPLCFSAMIGTIHLKRSEWSINDLKIELGLLFLIQILFSQTVNSWYLAWPLGFFLLAEEKSPIVLIALIWPLCYAPWLGNDSVIFYTATFHISGLLVFIHVLIKYLFNINFFKTALNLFFPFGRKIFTGDQL